jgi:hypothetical protein
MPTLDAYGVAMLIAVVLSPLVAVQVQKWIEMARERRNRKQWIFQTLMGTRAQRLSQEHVRALNMIDIEWYGAKIFGLRFQRNQEKAVISSWRSYLDQLNTAFDETEFNAWLTRNNDLFTKLLLEMSKSLGYEFDEVQLRRSIYAPRGHEEQELKMNRLRDGLVEVMAGEKAIPVRIETGD